MTKRKFNPAWPSAQADTPAARTQRSHKRRAKLNEIAHNLGYESWDKLVTDVINGKAEVTRVNPTAIIV